MVLTRKLRETQLQLDMFALIDNLKYHVAVCLPV